MSAATYDIKVRIEVFVSLKAWQDNIPGPKYQWRLASVANDRVLTVCPKVFDEAAEALYHAQGRCELMQLMQESRDERSGGEMGALGRECWRDA